MSLPGPVEREKGDRGRGKKPFVHERLRLMPSGKLWSWNARTFENNSQFRRLCLVEIWFSAARSTYPKTPWDLDSVPFLYLYLYCACTGVLHNQILKSMILQIRSVHGYSKGWTGAEQNSDYTKHRFGLDLSLPVVGTQNCRRQPSTAANACASEKRNPE